MALAEPDGGAAVVERRAGAAGEPDELRQIREGIRRSGGALVLQRDAGGLGGCGPGVVPATGIDEHPAVRQQQLLQHQSVAALARHLDRLRAEALGLLELL
ncbi:MAG: hypothetical protein E6K81_16200, partial [Candidatus Eisenbacteria bacterium]